MLRCTDQNAWCLSQLCIWHQESSLYLTAHTVSNIKSILKYPKVHSLLHCRTVLFLLDLIAITNSSALVLKSIWHRL